MQSQKYKLLATLRLAELNIYQGQFSRAQKELELLLRRTSAEDTTVNNAIKLIMLSEQFKSDSLSLAQFAKGELLIRQKYFSRAAKEFSALFESRKRLSPAAGLKAARLLRRLDKITETENLLLRFLQLYPRHEQSDEAVFMLAEIYERQKKPTQALQFYNRLLVDFPLSFYQQKARVRARILMEKMKERNSS